MRTQEEIIARIKSLEPDTLSLYDCPDCATRPGKDVDRG